MAMNSSDAVGDDGAAAVPAPAPAPAPAPPLPVPAAAAAASATASAADKRKSVEEANCDEEHPFFHYYGLLVHQQNM